MDVVFGTPSRCLGGEHVIITGTANGQEFQIRTTLDDLRLEPEDRQQAILLAARGLCLDAGATTWLQARAAIAGKTRKV